MGAFINNTGYLQQRFKFYILANVTVITILSLVSSRTRLVFGRARLVNKWDELKLLCRKNLCVPYESITYINKKLIAQ